MDIEEFIEMLFSRRTKLLSIKMIFSVLISFIVIFTIIDIISTREIDSSKSILNDTDVQFQIRRNENIYRDSIFRILSRVSSEHFKIVDSLKLESVNEIKNTILTQSLKSSRYYRFVIPVDTHAEISPFVNIYQIAGKYTIDFNRLNKILQYKKSGIVEEDIKYGNFISTDYIFKKKLRYDYLILFSFVVLALMLLLFYLDRIGSKSDKSIIENADKKLYEDKKRIVEAHDILEQDTINEKEIKRLKQIVKEITNNLASYNFENILESVIYNDVSKAEKKANELYSRSTLMLVLGLLVGVLGIAVFYFSLPEFGNKITIQNYFALTIRPTLVLIFIQSISFYLLKQYRTLINDYKYFYNEYLNKSRLFTIYQLSQSEGLNDDTRKIIDSLLIKNDKFELSNSIDESSGNVNVMEIFKTLLDKIK